MASNGPIAPLHSPHQAGPATGATSDNPAMQEGKHGPLDLKNKSQFIPECPFKHCDSEFKAGDRSHWIEHIWRSHAPSSQCPRCPKTWKISAKENRDWTLSPEKRHHKCDPNRKPTPTELGQYASLMSETLAQDFKKLVKDYKQHPDWATYEAQYGTKRASYELPMKLLKNGEVIPIPDEIVRLRLAKSKAKGMADDSSSRRESQSVDQQADNSRSRASLMSLDPQPQPSQTSIAHPTPAVHEPGPSTDSPSAHGQQLRVAQRSAKRHSNQSWPSYDEERQRTRTRQGDPPTATTSAAPEHITPECSALVSANSAEENNNHLLAGIRGGASDESFQMPEVQGPTTSEDADDDIQLHEPQSAGGEHRSSPQQDLDLQVPEFLALSAPVSIVYPGRNAPIYLQQQLHSAPATQGTPSCTTGTTEVTVDEVHGPIPDSWISSAPQPGAAAAHLAGKAPSASQPLGDIAAGNIVSAEVPSTNNPRPAAENQPLDELISETRALLEDLERVKRRGCEDPTSRQVFVGMLQDAKGLRLRVRPNHPSCFGLLESSLSNNPGLETAPPAEGVPSLGDGDTAAVDSFRTSAVGYMELTALGTGTAVPGDSVGEKQLWSNNGSMFQRMYPCGPDPGFMATNPASYPYPPELRFDGSESQDVGGMGGQYNPEPMDPGLGPSGQGQAEGYHYGRLPDVVVSVSQFDVVDEGEVWDVQGGCV